MEADDPLQDDRSTLSAPGLETSNEVVAAMEALKEVIQNGSLFHVQQHLRKNRLFVRNTIRLVHHAVSRGASVDVVRFLARKFPDDLRRDLIPLHLALFNERWDVVKVLIEAWPGAVTTKGHYGLLALHWAVLRNAPLRLVELLTEMHPEAIQTTGPPNKGWTPLHIAAAKACRMETFLFVLDKFEMGLRVKSMAGYLPLHSAIANDGGLEKVRIITDRYPQALLEETNEGGTPLQLAAYHRSPLVVVQFLSYKGPKAVVERSSADALPLQMAVQNGAPTDVIEFLARMTGACRVIAAFLSQRAHAMRTRHLLITKLQALRRRAVVYRQYGPVICSRVQFKRFWSQALELVDKDRQQLRHHGPDWATLRERHYDMERCLRAELLRNLEEADLERPNDENGTPRGSDGEGADPMRSREAGGNWGSRESSDEADYVAFEEHESSFPDPIQANNRVLLTKDVLKWCRKGDPKYVGFFIRRVEQLASGQRSRILAKKLKGGFKVAIFETYLEQKSGHRILWTAQALGEVLVWHVVAHKDVSRFARLIDSSLGRTSRQLSEALPALGIDSDIDSAISHADAIVLDPLGNTPLKLYAVTSNHMPQLADPSWTPPLRLTPEEREVVESAGTTLVLGRSGTGKTICLCGKIEFDRHFVGSSTAFTQLFIARSDRLRNFVKKAVGTDSCDFSTFDELILKLEQSVSSQSKFPNCQKVDFARFKRDFHRDPKLWGGVDALVVWTNLRSFIKGSIDALSSPGMILSIDDYLSVDKLGKKRCRLPPEQRHGVYKAFSAYRSFLEDTCLWDDCDRVSHLIESLKSLKINDPDKFESLRSSKVYVDECQDFTQAEILLFFYMSRSGDLFLCGDPAQSVVEGVQFRFKDVRSVAHFASGAAHRHLVPQKPKTLNVNYRSHSGIMNTAAAVQKRMTGFFPDEANLLDRGLFVGPRPGVLFEANLEILRSALSSLLSGSTILVHDEQKTSCKHQLEGYKLLYGIREAKGLEFKSVILFDFFAGIPKALQKPWRDLLLGNAGADFESRFPEMEGQLKLLYTAITRSVDRLLFVESKRSAAGEAFVRWSTTMTTRVQSSDEEPLAVVQKVDDIESFRMTVDEWVLTGFDSVIAADEAGDLEASRSFLEAALHCFQNAGDNRLVAKVQAHLASVRFRSQVFLDANSCTMSERSMADLLSRLLREGLWTEAAKFCQSALPLVPEYTQTQLRATLLPKLSRV